MADGKTDKNIIALGYLQSLSQEINRASIPAESIQLLIDSFKEKINNELSPKNKENLLKLVDQLEDVIDAEVFTMN